MGYFNDEKGVIFEKKQGACAQIEMHRYYTKPN
jgi:hypothetical protein